MGETLVPVLWTVQALGETGTWTGAWKCHRIHLRRPLWGGLVSTLRSKITLRAESGGHRMGWEWTAAGSP